MINNASIGGTLAVSGVSSLSGGILVNTATSTITNLTIVNATSTAATSTNLQVTNTFGGAGLSDCTGGNKLLWSASTKQFSCGVDAGASATDLLASYNNSPSPAIVPLSSGKDIIFNLDSVAVNPSFILNLKNASSSFQVWNASSTLFSVNQLGALSQGTFSVAGLTTLGQASSTRESVVDRIYIGSTATSTLQGNTTATSTLQGFLNVSGAVTSTSTFTGGLAANLLNITSSSATSSAANGLNLTAGCFSINGTCVGSGSSGITAMGPTGQTQTGPTVTLATSSTAFNGLTASTTITGSSNTLTFTNTLAGLLGVGGGGTGQTTYTAGDLLYSSAANTLSKLGIGTGGFGLAVSNGIPAWVATTTFSSGLAYAGGNVTNTGVLSITGTANQITASGSTGNVTLSLPSLLSLTQASSTRESVVDRIYIGGTATTTIVGDNATSTLSGGLTFTQGNVNLATNGVFLINNAQVLSASALGAGVTGSSLTSTGALSLGSIASGFGTINIGGNALTAGAGTLTSLTDSGALTVSGRADLNGQASTTRLSAFDRIYIGGSATSTLFGDTTGTSTLQGFLNVSGAVTSTSTFTGGLAANLLNITSSAATSSAANGLNLTAGCFAISGVCVGGGGSGSGTVNAGTLNRLTYYTGSSAVSSADFLTIDNTNQRLGISTSTPYARLQVSASTTPQFILSNPSLGSNLKHWFASTTPAGDLAWGTINDLNTSTSTLTTFTRAGLFGIGTSTPGSLLSLNNIVNFTTATSTFYGNGLNISAGCFAINNVCVSASGGATVTSVSNSDGTLTISPTTGAVVASLNLANPNVWTAASSTFAGNLTISGNATSTSATSTNLYISGAMNLASGLSYQINGTSALSATTLGSAVVNSSLTSVGTLTGLTVTGLSTLSGGILVNNATSTITNLVLVNATSTNATTTNLYVSTGNVGIGTTTPAALLSVAGSAYLGNSTANTLTIHSGVVNYPVSATSTVLNATINAWSISTSTSITPILSVSTFAGTGVASTTSAGRLGIGTTTPEARLSIDGSTAANLGIAGIHIIGTTTSATGGTQFGNRMIFYNRPTLTANTFVGNFLRIFDDSGLGNTARGMEVQSGSGTTTAGVNTGMFATAKTFGLQGITTGTAAGTLIPAGVYAESQSPTQGQALRVYTATTSTADLALLFQEGTQTFSGTGLKMNFGKGTGPFAGNFLNLQVNDVSALVASSTGTIGIGTSSPLAASGGVPSTHKGLHIESGTMAAGAAATATPVLLLDSDEAGAATRFFFTMRSAVSSSPVNQYAFNTNGTGYSRVAFSSGGADVAEWYPAKNDRLNLENGDLLMVDGSSFDSQVKRSEGKVSDSRVIGVVSTKPGLIAGNGPSIDTPHNNDVLVALAGRVPVKVSDENGKIRPGDRLTSSSIPGVAMKARGDGFTIGVALEGFDGINLRSPGVMHAEAVEVTSNEPQKRSRLITRDTRHYGGEISSTATSGSVYEETIQETILVGTTTVVAPPNGSAVDATTHDGKQIKVGKILFFVNLASVRLDGAIPQLASPGAGLAANQNGGMSWSVDQQSGKVTANLLGNVNMQGNNILDIGKISGMFGKWSIDESGKLVVDEVQAKRGTFEDSLNVGTREKPTGITIYDSSTGQSYCIRVTNGAMQPILGACVPGIAPPPPPPRHNRNHRHQYLRRRRIRLLRQHQLPRALLPVPAQALYPLHKVIHILPSCLTR